MLNPLKTWWRWRKRRHERAAYKAEVTHLRRELIVVYQKDQAFEELFIAKQLKINRLIKHIFEGVDGYAIGQLQEFDMHKEVVIKSFDQALSKLSQEFDARFAAYEKTGQYDRLTSPLTVAPEAKPDGRPKA